MDETLDRPRTATLQGGDGPPIPGLVVTFTGMGPTYGATELPAGGLTVGRGGLGAIPLSDGSVSRQHATIERVGALWRVTDLGSRNGTFVDGARVTGAQEFESPRVIRVGASLVLPVADVRPFLARAMELGTVLRGPSLQAAHAVIADASRIDGVVHLTGESGAGKEVGARVFHASGPHASGPFLAVNCAAIPASLAEALLFGARKGAYSGASTDAEGYLQAADGGTLFLDEVAELDPSVQAKLLRVLETREVTPLGATRARPVRIRVCSATHRGLRALVGDGRFREDLYFRLGRPEVAIPPLRARREEVSFLVQRALTGLSAGLCARPSFVELCLAQTWPVNVRELLAAVRDAGRAALRDGEHEVDAPRLPESAGVAFEATRPDADAAEARDDDDARKVKEGLAAHDGNVARTAAAMGVHRTQLRRWIVRFGIDPARYRPRG